MDQEPLIAGLDEVGWGSSAGPLISVVVVATNKDLAFLPSNVNDSKSLSEMAREALYRQLCATVSDKGLGCVWPYEIDQMGPKYALQESYTRALAELHLVPDLLVVDGTEWMNKVKSWSGRQRVEVKADAKYIHVAAASIIAKVFRDRLMVQEAKKRKAHGLPDYNWASNKGYHTPDHQRAIATHGLIFDMDVCTHRKSYTEKLLGKVPTHGCRSC